MQWERIKDGIVFSYVHLDNIVMSINFNKKVKQFFTNWLLIFIIYINKQKLKHNKISDLFQLKQ